MYIVNTPVCLFPMYLEPLFQDESLCKKLSYENELDLHENENVGVTQVHMNGFKQRLIQSRQKATQTWPIRGAGLKTSQDIFSIKLLFDINLGVVTLLFPRWVK